MFARQTLLFNVLMAHRFTVYKDADLFDFINAPVGKGRPIEKKLRPLIAVPTTAGTGSETTGTAILDITSMNFKTGIASRALKPTLGVVDSLNTRTCSRGAFIRLLVWPCIHTCRRIAYQLGSGRALPQS